jgi:hypothetical protein
MYVSEYISFNNLNTGYIKFKCYFTIQTMATYHVIPICENSVNAEVDILFQELIWRSFYHKLVNFIVKAFSIFHIWNNLYFVRFIYSSKVFTSCTGKNKNVNLNYFINWHDALVTK